MTILRKLSNGEAIFVGSGLTILTQSKVVGPLSFDIAKRAFEILKSRHPFLNCVITKKCGVYYFEKKKTPLVFLATTKPYQKALKELLNRRVSLKVLFEVVVVKEREHFVVMTKTHHAITDGISCIDLHKQFIEIAANLIDEKEISYPEISALPSIEDFFSSSVTRLNRREIAKEHLKKYKRSLPRVIPFLKGSKSLLFLQWVQKRFAKSFVAQLLNAYKRRCSVIKLLQKKLSEVEFLQLKESCKERGVKLNSALCSALLLAAYPLINAKKDERVLLLNAIVDLRSRVKVDITSEQLLTATANYQEYFSINSKTTFWELADQINQDLHNFIKTDALFENEYAVQEIFEAENRTTALYCSNLGLITINRDYGSLRLLDINYTALGVIPLICSASTFNNVTTLNFLTTSPLVSKKSVEKIAQNTHEILTKGYHTR